MIVGSSFFLAFGVVVAVPLILAFLQRRRRVFLPFGAYYLLQRLMKTRLRALQVHQWLKLLNRIALILIMTAYWADLKRSQWVYDTKEEFFAVFVDVGRASQVIHSEGQSIGEKAQQALQNLLSKLSLQSRGMVFAFSDRCEALTDMGLASDFRGDLRLPFANAYSTAQGLAACEAKLKTIVGQRSVSVFVISSFPDSLQVPKEKSSYRFISVGPDKYEAPATSSLSVMEKEDVFQLEAREEHELLTISLFDKKPTEAKSQGVFVGLREWPLQSDHYLWLRSVSSTSKDHWASSTLRRMQSLTTSKINLWAKAESRGFTSLYTALKNEPSVEVVRWIGEEPPDVQDPMIAYGDLPASWDQRSRVWVFLNPQREHSSIVVRDRKTWTPDSAGTDAERAFLMDRPGGRILIRQVLLLDTNGSRTLDSFRDGTPALLSDSRGRWITPFDLEDLTTDLTLEATFIPLLYKSLELFLKEESPREESLEPLWLFSSWRRPGPEVTHERRWPGIYGHAGAMVVVEPLPAPQSFVSLSDISKSNAQELRQEWLSLRPSLLLWLSLSLILELLLCGLSTRNRLRALTSWLAILMAQAMGNSLSAEAIRPLSICAAPTIEAERKGAIDQLGVDFARFSNLELSEPLKITDKTLSSCAIVFFSSLSALQFSQRERDRYRLYLERGGLFVFDDPLASQDSEFYRSVKREMGLIFPGRSFEKVAHDNVLLKTFYLLTDISGRRLSAPFIEGISFDNRWIAIFSFNDLLGSQLRLPSGDYAFSVSPYGQSQRISARRMLLNFIMYSATLNYKDDAIHLPHILKRRTR